MTKEAVCDAVRQIGIVPAVRVSSTDDAHFAVEAVASGGIPIIEMTMKVPGRHRTDLARYSLPSKRHRMIGAGTVLNVETAQQCVDAGASFITAPGFNSRVVEFATKHNVAVLAGALTPTGGNRGIGRLVQIL